MSKYWSDEGACDVYGGYEFLGSLKTPEQAARIVALLNEGEAAMAACRMVKDYLNRLEDLQEDDPLLAMRRHFHGPLHRAIDAAIAAAPASKEPAK